MANIIEKYLDRYDEMVLERWWWRMKIPGRWLVRVLIAKPWGWIKDQMGRAEPLVNIADEHGVIPLPTVVFETNSEEVN